MRLYSISPKYLDTKGLLGVWREGLLAKHVLEGITKGYKNHPQLIRFKRYKEPLVAINSFLYFVAQEGLKRGYKFDTSKLDLTKIIQNEIPVTTGQVIYEFKHLCKKLSIRDKKRYNLQCTEKVDIGEIEVNSIFYIIDGGVEEWERVKEF